MTPLQTVVCEGVIDYGDVLTMRKYYMDNLRWLTILLLIPYHAAQAWNTWGEPNYIFFEGNRLISGIIVFFSPFFMPILFVLAGMSTKYALQKRTMKQYFFERVKKLLIPFVFGTIALMPILTYLGDKFNYGYTGSFLEHYRVFFTKYTDLIGADGGFSVGQLWFVLYLFVISVVFMGVLAIQNKMNPKAKEGETKFFLVVLAGVPLPLLSELLSIGGKSLAEYLYLFLLGYYLLSKDEYVEKTEQYKWIFLAIGLVATILNVYLFLWCDTSYEVANTIAKFVAEWFMLLAMLGIGKKFLNFSGKLHQYMSHRSFLFYILHFVWIVLFQYVLHDVLVHHTVLLFLVPVVIAYVATFLCCEVCIRIPVLCFLMGTKTSATLTCPTGKKRTS